MFGTISVLAMSMIFAPLSQAQVTISDEQTTAQETGGADLTIDAAGSIIIDTPGPAVTLNSDNALSNAGVIAITNVDNATGVSLESGANRSFTNSNTISIAEDFTPEDTDSSEEGGDPFVDGPFAQGAGRTGILISGASPFEGNIDLETTSVVSVEGNDSFGINLTNTAMAQEGLTGNLSNAGQINVLGTNAVGVNLASGLTGNFDNSGIITTTGEGAQAINVGADIQGGFVNAGSAVNTGFRFTARPGLSNSDLGISGRDQLGAEDLLQAGSAINIGANISQGILLEQRFEDVLDVDGNPTLDTDGNAIQTLTGTSNVVQNGSAPAVLIDGNGIPIAIGLVANVTDPAAADFDENLQFAFINQGNITANGVFDDVDATTVQVADATLAGGLNNSGTLTSTAFVASPETSISLAENGLSSGTGQARVIVFGDGAIADEINNSGVLIATASEAADDVFGEGSVPIFATARDVVATAIDIESNAVVNSIENSGGISAVVVGRRGEAIGVIDRSGNVNSFNNTGTIAALTSTSDPTGESSTDLSIVAVDLSANTTGLAFTQSESESGVTPFIIGDIRLGAGDDTALISAGSVGGDIDFSSGNDSLTLAGSSIFTGSITNSDGLNLNVTDTSQLTLNNSDTISVTSANFDGSSTFSPTLDGSVTDGEPVLVAINNAGAPTAGGLDAGDINFADGATIAPNLTNVIGLSNTTFALARAENELTIGDLNTLTSADTPFLYNTSFAVDPNDPNTLLITLDLRDPSASIADGGLGLDVVQAAAFAPAFTALSSNTSLGDAFASITDGVEFNQAFNQILPEFAAAAKQFVFSNVDGATGAVSNHLDTTRRSPEQPGGAWLQQFAYFADRELAGLSEQYRGSGFGFSGGIDTAFGPFHAVGINLGFASTEIEDVVGVDEPLDVLTLQGGVYAGWASGGLSVDAYAGGGYSDFEQNRQVEINSFSGSSRADRSGTHINGSLRAGYDLELNDQFWFRPVVSLDYLRLNENAYTETGDPGIALSVDSRTSELGGAAGVINFGARFEGKRTWIRPSLRAGYRYDFINDPVATNFRFVGLPGADGQTFNSDDALIESFAFPDNGIILGFSIAAGSQYSSIGFDFDSDIRDGFIRHTGRVVVRLLF